MRKNSVMNLIGFWTDAEILSDKMLAIYKSHDKESGYNLKRYYATNI